MERDPISLADQPTPTVEETNTQEESRARKIIAWEFEEAWNATAGSE